MDFLQNGIEHLNPLVSLLWLAILFLIASIAGWYVGNLIQWFRRWLPSRGPRIRKFLAGVQDSCGVYLKFSAPFDIAARSKAVIGDENACCAPAFLSNGTGICICSRESQCSGSQKRR